jgi:hypothetical protein
MRSWEAFSVRNFGRKVTGSMLTQKFYEKYKDGEVIIDV